MLHSDGTLVLLRQSDDLPADLVVQVPNNSPFSIFDLLQLPKAAIPLVALPQVAVLSLGVVCLPTQLLHFPHMRNSNHRNMTCGIQVYSQSVVGWLDWRICNTDGYIQVLTIGFYLIDGEKRLLKLVGDFNAQARDTNGSGFLIALHLLPGHNQVHSVDPFAAQIPTILPKYLVGDG